MKPLTFAAYQNRALTTDHAPLGGDQTPAERDRALMVPLLGLAGEAGSILTEYKKWLREQESYAMFNDRIEEELGDVLWYVANLASKANLDLDRIARRNLRKAKDRWRHVDESGGLTGRPLFDADFPEAEQLPRQFEADFERVAHPDGHRRVQVRLNGESYGDPLTDNSRTDDGYRFHDVFHLAFAAVLGWSPITRSVLKRKRKSDPTMDEVEDGARAKIAEEAVSLVAFAYAKDHSFLFGVDRVGYALLSHARNMTKEFEVKSASLADWEKALLDGYSAWRQIVNAGGGRVRGDLTRRTFEFVPAPTRSLKGKRAKS